MTMSTVDEGVSMSSNERFPIEGVVNVGWA